jgi:hypothetical protein
VSSTVFGPYCAARLWSAASALFSLNHLANEMTELFILAPSRIFSAPFLAVIVEYVSSEISLFSADIRNR